MSDQLREALETWAHWDTSVPGFNKVGRDWNTVLAAARRFLALTETGPREWCAEHDLPYTPPPIGECAFWMFPLADPDEDNPCRRTQIYVIPADYLTEEE